MFRGQLIDPWKISDFITRIVWDILIILEAPVESWLKNSEDLRKKISFMHVNCSPSHLTKETIEHLNKMDFQRGQLVHLNFT